MNGRKPTARASSRPSSKSALSILEDLRVTAPGTKSSLSVEEQLHLQIFSDALAGDVASIKIVLDWIREREALRPGSGPNIKFLYGYLDPKRADDAFLALGIASELPERSTSEHPFLQLEPWFVDYALARLDTEALAETDMRDIRQRTRPLNENDSAWSGGFDV